MTIAISVHGLKSIEAKAWKYGNTAAVETRFLQDDGELFQATLYVRGGGFTTAVAIAHALNGAGKSASGYDPELDGVGA